MIGMWFKSIIFFATLLVFTLSLSAQEYTPDPGAKRLTRNIANEIVYESSWAVNFHLRNDGWQLGAEIAKNRNYFKSLIYRFEIAEFKHPKQVRQNKDPFGGIFGNNGIRPFVFGKQNSLFALHASVGQKYLLAERARRNGVMINYFYAGGVSLGILKPYFIRVCANIQCSQFEIVTYEPDRDNSFLNYDFILGGAGFGTGWKLGFRPGLHAKTGLQFDWSSQDDIIKSIEVGLSTDAYIGKVPIMVTEDNKFLFINAFVGVSFGKKK
jgi:hypothetical protein